MESYEAPDPPYARTDEAAQWYRSGYAHGWNAALATAQSAHPVRPDAAAVPIADDGYGITEGCTDPRCDIEVVRPGSVQCSNYCGRSSDPVPAPASSPSPPEAGQR